MTKRTCIWMSREGSLDINGDRVNGLQQMGYIGDI